MSRYPSTIDAPVEHELVVNRSRFIARVAPAETAGAAEAVIGEVRRRMWDASHHCVGLVTGVLGDHARSSDDGEPSGTAGVPILEVLRRRDLTDVVAVVTRYYGGVKLGAGGLVRAYGTAASEALDRAVVVERRSLRQVRISAPHAQAGRIDNALRGWIERHSGVLGDVRYEHSAEFEVWVPAAEEQSLSAAIAELTGGGIVPEVRGRERIVQVRPGGRLEFRDEGTALGDAGGPTAR